MQQFTGKFQHFGKRQLKKGSCEVAEDEAGGPQLCSNFAASVKKTEERALSVGRLLSQKNSINMVFRAALVSEWGQRLLSLFAATPCC